MKFASHKVVLKREMKIQFRQSCRLALMLLIIFVASVSAQAQTTSELRQKYGEPEKIKLKDGQSELERFKVSPDITLTVTYSKEGKATELVIEPMRPLVAPVEPGDLMPTEVVINIINELVPVSLRGELTFALHTNGGDHKMKLDHLGCTGIDNIIYKHVTIICVTWCQGGTFSATVRWQESKYPSLPIDGKSAR